MSLNQAPLPASPFFFGLLGLMIPVGIVNATKRKENTVKMAVNNWRRKRNVLEEQHNGAHQPELPSVSSSVSSLSSYNLARFSHLLSSYCYNLYLVSLD